jgi:hypothetical protein
MAKDVLGHIELDPASDAFANTVVGAARFYTRQDDVLSQPWEAKTVYLNPPGGRLRNQSQQKLFYWKLVQEWQQGRVGSAVFLAFSIELAQTSQVDCSPGMAFPTHFPFCVPSRRIRFCLEEGGKLIKKEGPTHANMIVYLPPDLRRERQCDWFAGVFSELGAVTIPARIPRRSKG